jgi:hypothetical protein
VQDMLSKFGIDDSNPTSKKPVKGDSAESTGSPKKHGTGHSHTSGDKAHSKAPEAASTPHSDTKTSSTAHAKPDATGTPKAAKSHELSPSVARSDAEKSENPTKPTSAITPAKDATSSTSTKDVTTSASLAKSVADRSSISSTDDRAKLDHADSTPLEVPSRSSFTAAEKDSTVADTAPASPPKSSPTTAAKTDPPADSAPKASTTGTSPDVATPSTSAESPATPAKSEADAAKDLAEAHAKDKASMTGAASGDVDYAKLMDPDVRAVTFGDSAHDAAAPKLEFAKALEALAKANPPITHAAFEFVPSSGVLSKADGGDYLSHLEGKDPTHKDGTPLSKDELDADLRASRISLVDYFTPMGNPSAAEAEVKAMEKAHDLGLKVMGMDPISKTDAGVLNAAAAVLATYNPKLFKSFADKPAAHKAELDAFFKAVAAGKDSSENPLHDDKGNPLPLMSAADAAKAADFLEKAATSLGSDSLDFGSLKGWVPSDPKSEKDVAAFKDHFYAAADAWTARSKTAAISDVLNGPLTADGKTPRVAAFAGSGHLGHTDTGDVVGNPTINSGLKDTCGHPYKSVIVDPSGGGMPTKAAWPSLSPAPKTPDDAKELKSHTDDFGKTPPAISTEDADSTGRGSDYYMYHYGSKDADYIVHVPNAQVHDSMVLPPGLMIPTVPLSPSGPRPNDVIARIFAKLDDLF